MAANYDHLDPVPARVEARRWGREQLRLAFLDYPNLAQYADEVCPVTVERRNAAGEVTYIPTYVFFNGQYRLGDLLNKLEEFDALIGELNAALEADTHTEADAAKFAEYFDRTGIVIMSSGFTFVFLDESFSDVRRLAARMVEHKRAEEGRR